MAFNFRNITRRILIIANLVAVVLFGLPGLIPYADPQRWWWLNLIGLLFPYVFFVVVFFFLFWIVVKPKYGLLSLVIILLCWRQVAVIFRLNTKDFTYKTNNTALRVLSWNVRVFEGMEKTDSILVKDGIKSVLESSGADVLCLQEFSQYDSNGVKKNYIQAVQEAGYPYFVFLRDYEKASVDYRSGVAIFSKTPLLNGRREAFTASRESIVHADIVIGADTVRIFTTHLQSFRFSRADYRNIEWIKRRGDITNPANKNILAKMKAAIQIRGIQAQQIRPLLDSCPYPEIVCGDFNDVPNSYAYWHIRGARRDAFIEKGNGVSRTYVSLAPMLRIDYILCDNRFKVEQYTTANSRFSDHLPVIADVKLERK